MNAKSVSVQAYCGFIINIIDLILPEVSSFRSQFEDFTKILQKCILFCSLLLLIQAYVHDMASGDLTASLGDEICSLGMSSIPWEPAQKRCNNLIN